MAKELANINHSERAHALLSASGASRWMKCTPSARLEDPFPSQTSIHAEEGTLAHEFAELELRMEQRIITSEVYQATIKDLRKHKLYTHDMEEHVKKYVDIVLEKLAASKGGTLLIEEKVNFTLYVPEGFGTCDAVILPGKTKILFDIDLKYGKGVQVFAEENPQLKLYALGAWIRYGMSYDIERVCLMIVQPRLNHVSKWEIPLQELLDWADNELKPKAELAYAGEGELCAGSHCRFCKIAPRCKTLANYSIQEAKLDFADPEYPDSLLSDKEMVEMYKQIPVINMWIKAVHGYMHTKALEGKVWKGLKLVEGKSDRSWIDEAKVIEALEDNLYTSSQIFKSKLAGIGDIEKLLGKGGFKEILGDLVKKPPGAKSLVAEEDPRPKADVSSAIRDFQ